MAVWYYLQQSQITMKNPCKNEEEKRATYPTEKVCAQRRPSWKGDSSGE